MAVTIRLRQADLEVLAEADNWMTSDSGAISSKHSKAWSSFYERVLAAELKPKKTVHKGISVNTAIEAFRGVLASRLVVPAGNPGAAWFAQLQNRINSSGLTVALCTAAATAAGAAWKGAIKAESIIRQADVLLSEAGWVSLDVLSAPQKHEDMAPDEL